MVDRLSKTDILSLDYGGKVMLLEKVGQEILDLQIEYAGIAGRNAELRARLEVLKQVKSVLQSSIKAESPEGGSDIQRRHELTRNPIYNKPKESTPKRKRA
jgi:hypothetical protein